jgi:hypothetical protein
MVGLWYIYAMMEYKPFSQISVLEHAQMRARIWRWFFVALVICLCL